MSKKRLSAQPIREGVLENSGHIELVWRDYLWNNGHVSRMWYVDPEAATEDQIEIRELGSITKLEHKS